MLYTPEICYVPYEPLEACYDKERAENCFSSWSFIMNLENIVGKLGTTLTAWHSILPALSASEK